MVKLILVLAIVMVLSLSIDARRTRPSAQQYAQFFTRWLASRNTTYTAAVFQRRFNVYKSNYDFVDDHNERFRDGRVSFTMALNQWADLDENEYRAKMGFIAPDQTVNDAPAPVQTTNDEPAPVMLGAAPGLKSDPIADALCARFGLMCKTTPSPTVAPAPIIPSTAAPSSSTGVSSSSSSPAVSSSSSSGVSSSSSSSSSAIPSSTAPVAPSSTAPAVVSSSARPSSSSSSSAVPTSSAVPSSSSSSSSSSSPAVSSSSSSTGAAFSSSSSAAAASATGPAAGATEIDWRQYGYIGPVKDQGRCGSCWTFASTGVMEASWAFKTRQLLRFSEQELLDCAAGGTRTCASGGTMQDSWNWLISGAVRRSPMSSQAYPYTGNSNADCLYNASRATNAVFLSRTYVSNNDNSLVNAVRRTPAIAVAVHGSGRAFQFYSSGVLSDSSCSSTTLDHAVVVVGFGTDAATGYDYWLVRNSWGTGWGQGGYAKIRRNFNNMCGVNSQASYIIA